MQANFACMLIIKSIYDTHSKQEKKRVELMASYTPQHVSHTKITWDGWKKKLHIHHHIHYESHMKRLEKKIFSPLSLNVVFQYLFSSHFFLCPLWHNCRRLYSAPYWIRVCFKAQAQAGTLNGHNRHLWCMSTSTELVCTMRFRVLNGKFYLKCTVHK